MVSCYELVFKILQTLKELSVRNKETTHGCKSTYDLDIGLNSSFRSQDTAEHGNAQFRKSKGRASSHIPICGRILRPLLDLLVRNILTRMQNHNLSAHNITNL